MNVGYMSFDSIVRQRFADLHNLVRLYWEYECWWYEFLTVLTDKVGIDLSDCIESMTVDDLSCEYYC